VARCSVLLEPTHH